MSNPQQPISDPRIDVRIAGLTDVGLVRPRNEDHIAFDRKLGIAVLADGMGGHQAGEIASRMAVESVMQKLQQLARYDAANQVGRAHLPELLANSISDCNAAIYRASRSLDAKRNMGTTVVAVLVRGTRIHVGHVGDSRLYLLREQTLKRITTDHSLVQDLLERGFYTGEEVRLGDIGHIVTRALGTAATVEVDTCDHELQAGDLLLLCSDGLSDMVYDQAIQETLLRHDGDLQRTAEALVSLAKHNGGKDNISVILMEAADSSP